ncbi:methionine--tRNA ligase [Candidatus Wolfebacteria bacterium]|nr:methionine--tRNA ligase [Candidatus Wolfebacteria bacterium]
MNEKFYITTPIYYASGEPHIGHALTTICADVISRYQKSKGKEVFLLTGLDEHGSKIAGKAEVAGKTPQEFVDAIAPKYTEAWTALNIKYNDFIRTSSEKHKKGVIEFIKKIEDKGDIYESFYEGLYCVDCEKFYTEKELVGGLCPDHLKPPQKLKEKNYFFNLKKYLPEIREKIKNGKLKIIPDARKNEILSIIDSGIPDFSITREKDRVKWGIPYTKDETQLIYVWVDALANYITALGYSDGENFKKFWPTDIHTIGADIAKFHAIFWPGLLLSAGLPLPKIIFAQGLITVNGQKMSKTIGNVISPNDLIPKFGPDGTRYLLLSQFPTPEHGDVKADNFSEKYNSDLANGLGNLFERIFTMVLNYEIEINETKISPEIKNSVRETKKQYESDFENFNLFGALQTIFGFVKKLDQYINEKEPWNMHKNKDAELLMVLNSLFYGAEEIIKLIEPFMPEKTGLAADFAQKIKNREMPEETKLNLFPRI